MVSGSHSCFLQMMQFCCLQLPKGKFLSEWEPQIKISTLKSKAMVLRQKRVCPEECPLWVKNKLSTQELVNSVRLSVYQTI